MITIFYFYWSKKENKFKEAEQIFYSVQSAIRFCWSMKNRKMVLNGWSCFDLEDNEYMQRKVDISKINGWR